MVNNQTSLQHNAVLNNENPTPLEIKEQMAKKIVNVPNRRIQKENTSEIIENGSDQENQKPNGNIHRKPKQKGTKQKISLTPFFKGRDADKDSEREKIREIFDIKPYSPFEEKNKYRDARPTRDNSYRRRLEHDEIPATEKIFVGKLPLHATQEDLVNYFSKFGNVTEAIIKDSRGFGFVTFESILEAEAALDSTQIHSLFEAEIEVKRALPNRFQSSTNVNQSQATSELTEKVNSIHMGMSPQPFIDYHNIQYTYPIFMYPPPPTPLISSVEDVEGVIALPSESADENNTENDTTSKYQRPNSNENQRSDDNDFAQQKKLFIGGLHWKTQDSDLREYFSKKGTVTDAMVIMEPTSQRSRGFGFVVFSNAEDAESVFEDKGHEINGKLVDVKRAISKDEDIDNELVHVKVDKIFVGGIRKDTTKESLTEFFETKFGGKVTRVDMKVDKEGQNKGYAFISFDSTEVVDEICQNKYHRIGPHMCEVKKAQSKEVQNGVEHNSPPHDNNNGYKMSSNYGYYGYPGGMEHFFGPIAPVPYPAAYSAPMSYHYSSYDPMAPVPIIPQNVPMVPGAYEPNGGTIIGGTWYPKMPSPNSTPNGETNDDNSPLGAAIYYQTLPYPYPHSYPANAFCQTTQTKD